MIGHDSPWKEAGGEEGALAYVRGYLVQTVLGPVLYVPSSPSSSSSLLLPVTVEDVANDSVIIMFPERTILFHLGLDLFFFSEELGCLLFFSHSP